MCWVFCSFLNPFWILRTESGTFLDGNMRVNKNGLQLISQENVTRVGYNLYFLLFYYYYFHSSFRLLWYFHFRSRVNFSDFELILLESFHTYLNCDKLVTKLECVFGFVVD